MEEKQQQQKHHKKRKKEYSNDPKTIREGKKKTKTKNQKQPQQQQQNEAFLRSSDVILGYEFPLGDVYYVNLLRKHTSSINNVLDNRTATMIGMKTRTTMTAKANGVSSPELKIKNNNDDDDETKYDDDVAVVHSTEQEQNFHQLPSMQRSQYHRLHQQQGDNEMWSLLMKASMSIVSTIHKKRRRFVIPSSRVHGHQSRGYISIVIDNNHRSNNSSSINIDNTSEFQDRRDGFFCQVDTETAVHWTYKFLQGMISENSLQHHRHRLLDALDASDSSAACFMKTAVSTMNAKIARRGDEKHAATSVPTRSAGRDCEDAVTKPPPPPTTTTTTTHRSEKKRKAEHIGQQNQRQKQQHEGQEGVARQEKEIDDKRQKEPEKPQTQLLQNEQGDKTPMKQQQQQQQDLEHSRQWEERYFYLHIRCLVKYLQWNDARLCDEIKVIVEDCMSKDQEQQRQQQQQQERQQGFMAAGGTKSSSTCSINWQQLQRRLKRIVGQFHWNESKLCLKKFLETKRNDDGTTNEQ